MLQSHLSGNPGVTYRAALVRYASDPMQNARSTLLFIPLVAEKVTRLLSLVDKPSTFIPNAFACIPSCSTRQAADLRDLVGMELLLDVSWRYNCVVRRNMLWPRTSGFSSFVFSLPLCHCQASLRRSRPVENLSTEEISVSTSSWHTLLDIR